MCVIMKEKNIVSLSSESVFKIRGVCLYLLGQQGDFVKQE